MSSHRTPWLVAFVALAIASCGVPTDRSATKVPARDVPFGLLNKNSGVSTPSSGEERAVIYLARNDKLVAAPRNIGRPVTLDSLLDTLRAGPTSGEVSAGVRSALPASRSVRLVALARGTATLDLDRRFTTLSAGDQVLALAQIVFTVTGRPGVGLVRFTQGRVAIEVPRGNGALTSARVARDDYIGFAPAG